MKRADGAKRRKMERCGMDRYKIMIVDDEAEVREGIVRYIDWDKLGFSVVAEAENGQDALEKAEGVDLDVVLTDIKMPFMDGLAMGAELVKIHPAVKLIILTGFDAFEYAQEAIRLHVIEYALKPVDVTELTRTLQRVRETLDRELAERRDIELLQKSYEKSRPLLRERFISELLWGGLAEEEIARQLFEFGIDLGGARKYVVSVFDIDAAASEARISGELLPISVRRTIEELFLGSCRLVTFTSAARVVAITAWDTGNPVADVMRVGREVIFQSRRLFGIRVFCGVSRVYGRLADVHTAFREGRYALEYRPALGGAEAISIQDMEGAEQPIASFDHRYEKRLFSALRSGSDELLRQLAEEIVSRYETRVPEGFERHAYAASLLHAICSAIESNHLGRTDAAGRVAALEEPPRELMRQAFLTDLFLNMSEYMRAHRLVAAEALVGEAKRILEREYADSSLSVERLAEKLHISPSYCSAVFRQGTGMTCVQYLTGVRMRKAEELLRATDEKTYLIASRVGYDEPNYFSYVFKKHFGVSPSKLRN